LDKERARELLWSSEYGVLSLVNMVENKLYGIPVNYNVERSGIHLFTWCPGWG